MISDSIKEVTKNFKAGLFLAYAWDCCGKKRWSYCKLSSVDQRRLLINRRVLSYPSYDYPPQRSQVVYRFIVCHFSFSVIHRICFSFGNFVEQILSFIFSTKYPFHTDHVKQLVPACKMSLFHAMEGIISGMVSGRYDVCPMMVPLYFVEQNNNVQYEEEQSDEEEVENVPSDICKVRNVKRLVKCWNRQWFSVRACSLFGLCTFLKFVFMCMKSCST